MKTMGIYVHIPFCRQKCLYCDFPSFSGQESLYEEYAAALDREITGRGGLFSAVPVDTVFFGGGTPTALPARQLAKLLQSLREYFAVTADAEISLEANPGTVDAAALHTLRQAGFNRISFGVQSFHDPLLKALGRLHDSAGGAAAVEAARRAGFDNVSVDLMYGLPGQTLAQLQESLRRAVALAVDHLSVYGLKVEDGTPFGDAWEAGALDLPLEETEEAMYDFVTRWLPEQGYGRYEISNYSLPGRYCRHNLRYWRYLPYLGLGSAAHSFIEGQRRANVTDVKEYIHRIQNSGTAEDFVEEYQRSHALSEYVFLALRTCEGMALAEFSQCFAADFRQLYQPVIEQLQREGLISLTGEKLFLTERGMKYSNVVFRAFIADNSQ